MRTLFPVIAIILILAIPAGIFAANDDPQYLAESFHGSVAINGQQAPVGTLIEARINGVVQGSINVDPIGQYGGGFSNLLVDPPSDYTPGNQYTIHFYINGAQASQTAVFASGGGQTLDLSVGGGVVTTTATTTPSTTVTTVTATTTQTQSTTTTTSTTPTTTSPPVTTTTSNGQPTNPAEFYGTVTIGDQPAPPGTTVEARGSGVIPGSSNPFTVTTAGQYGVSGQFTPKLIVEGSIAEGTPLTFYVNNVQADLRDASGTPSMTYPFHALSVTQLNVHVTPTPPHADFSVAPTSGFAPLEVHFTDLSTGVPSAWEWDFGDNTKSYDQNPVKLYSQVGAYTVSLKVTNAFGTDTTTKTNIVIALSRSSGPSGGGGTGLLPGYSSSSWVSGASPTPNVTVSVKTTPIPTGTSVQGAVIPMNPDGSVAHAVSVFSDDNVVSLGIIGGTMIQDPAGKAVFRINILRVPASDVPPAPAGFLFAGYAYDIQPTGTTFNPPAILSFAIPDSDWSSLSGSALSLKWYNGTTSSWESLPTNVDQGTKTVSTPISHLSIFGLFAPVPPTTIPTTTIVTATTTTPPAPSIFGSDMMRIILQVIIIVIIIIAVVILIRFILARRKKPAEAPSIDENQDWMELK
jgi:PKD repeat protein